MKYNSKFSIFISAVFVFALLAGTLTACTPQSRPTPAPSATQNSSASQAQGGSEHNPYEISAIQDSAPEKVVYISINSATLDIAGKTLQRWLYTDDSGEVYDAGKPIIVHLGDTLTLNVTNNTSVQTNIHWHGLSVESSQDGPGIVIEPNGGKHTYTFKVEHTGTYWYHSHERPVRDQVDEGMYAPFIVKAPEDAQYAKDYILMLDDWTVPGAGGSSGGGMMHSEKIGNVDTVNGKTKDEISPILIQTGEIHKLRLVGASTALTQELVFPVPVRVTHTDGWALAAPYETKTLSVSPGERYDVELQMTGDKSETLFIKNQRDNGMQIPILYTHTKGAPVAQSPFVPAKDTGMLAFAGKTPDIEMRLSEAMGGGMMSGMQWAINGEIYPNLDAYQFALGKEYVIRFTDNSMHEMEHPMHIHGAHFVVLSVNGETMKSEIHKDTINIPFRGYVDVVVRFDKPGDWMVHCHILDHEDGGMMTSIYVS